MSEDPTQLLLNLPPVGRALTVRGLREPGFLHLGALLALALAGLVYIVWAAKDALGAWWTRLGGRLDRDAVLRLPAR